MLTRRRLDATTTEDGREIELYQRGDEWTIQVDRWELMSSRSHGSEEAMARLAVEALGPRRQAGRWLIGGLGMGFTLRASLDALQGAPGSSIVVAEVFGAVIEWNRGVLAHLARRPLDDPRVAVRHADVVDLLARSDDRFDAILLDIDNGPEALTLDANRRLYERSGLGRLRQRLTPDGVLAVWSAGDDERFRRRLAKAGFTVKARRVRSRPDGRGERHVIFLARPR